MKKLLLIALVTPILSGCFITTSIQGQGDGKITSVGGHDCGTGTTNNCTVEYTQDGTETFTATADSDSSLSKWGGCAHETLETCTTSWTQDNADNGVLGIDTLTVTATFDENDQTVQAAQYTYNALGQRITKTVNNQTTIFQYDLDGSLLAEIDAATQQPVREHVHVNGEPVAQISTINGDIALQYVHADHLGTPTLLTNILGNVVADIEATPFGEKFVDYAEVTHNRRFPGQYKDVETGLHYNYFRDYDPSLGRYIQSDPRGIILDFSDQQRQIAAQMGLPVPDLAHASGLNQMYGYAGQNPLKYIDQAGEWAVAVGIVGGAVAILYIVDDIIDKCEQKCPDRSTREGNAEFVECLTGISGFLSLYGASTGSTGAASTVGGATCDDCE